MKMDAAQKRTWLIVGGAGAGVLLLACCCGGVALMSGGVADAGHPERKPIREWVRSHVNDPDSVEFVEWGGQIQWEPSALAYDVAIREKNAFGAKRLTVLRFVVENGNVIEAIPMDKTVKELEEERKAKKALGEAMKDIEKEIPPK